MVTKADPRFTDRLKAFARTKLLELMEISDRQLSSEQNLVLEYIINAMYGTITWWISNNKPIPVEEIIRIANLINTQGALTVLKANASTK